MSSTNESSGDANAAGKPKQLTPQQLREQRLARFEKGGRKPAASSNGQLKAPPPQTTEQSQPTTAAVEPISIETTKPEAMETNPNLQLWAQETVALAEKEDQDLQAAIALSMGLPPPGAKKEENNMVMEGNSDIEDDRKPAAVDKKTTSSVRTIEIPKTNPQHFSGRVRTWYESAAPYNILEFHDCMWDKGVTTQNDQKRWLAQGIQFKDEHSDDSATGGGSGNPNEAASSLLETIISGPGVWCLTQQHGGPCGVLASIQAELLAILLFGPRTVHPISMISIDFPDDLSTELTRAAPDMSKQKMRQVLALSMGMILARASLMPNASLQDDAVSSQGDGNDEKESFNALNPQLEPTVRLILPKNELWNTHTCLEWQHLEPWNASDGGTSISKNFLSYTISLNKQTQSFVGDSATVKRQRLGSTGEDAEHTCKELAHATAQFLLETNSLNWFQRPGGVVLMVMSICASRGIAKTQGDMDDLAARLTTNFGHCSQELINLLLTGQAVSNVFDHTLRPSGELVCRGIQSQPAVGYLTQLEAMRYLEVGAFYKSPRFPVWVIGSSSHFTVMFGDASALQESASDALLEKVRRAFKRMDGGAEENGFIQTHQLGDFLKSLDLNSYSEHEVQTLAAILDRYGAGIILWEDLWKRTSRLLTGASLESILEGNDESNGNGWMDESSSYVRQKMLNGDNTAVGGNTAASTNAAPLSDEELARKLQAEWNDEVEPLPAAASLVDAFDSDTGRSTPPITNTSAEAHPAAETFGRTFSLYHYNGLRGGNFKAFRVTRLSADEAIGASVSLGGSDQASAFGGGGELDSVLRTKWPSCKIDWLNGSPPSID